MQKSKLLNVILAAIYAFVFTFCFFTMEYQDGRVNACIGYQLCYSLFHGELGQLYNAFSFTYGILIFVIYTIWSLPLFIIDSIRGEYIDVMHSMIAGLWYKSLLAIFMVICCVLFYRIVKEIIGGKEQSFWMSALLAASPLMLFPPIAITQCDVMELTFILAGVYGLIKEDDKRFILYFAIAITMKYMALFIFIPLFFYRYKKAKQMMIVGGAALSLLLVSVIILSFSEGVRNAITNPSFFDVTAMLAEFYEGKTISLGIGGMSVVVAYFLGVCLVSHMADAKGSRSMHIEWVLWLCLAGWYTLFIFYGAHTYWYVLLAPFLLLILLNDPAQIKRGLFLEVVLANMMLLERVAAEGWVFGGNGTFSGLVLKYLFPGHYTLLKNLLDRVTVGLFTKCRTIYVSVIVVCAAALLVLYFPKAKEKAKELDTKAIKIAVWVSVILLALWTGLTFAEQLRISKGWEYSISDMEIPENVQIEENAVVLQNGDTIYGPYTTLEAGSYRLTVYGDHLQADQLQIYYYHIEDHSIEYTVIEQGEDYLTVEFTLNEYLENVEFRISNQADEPVTVHSYKLNAL